MNGFLTHMFFADGGPLVNWVVETGLVVSLLIVAILFIRRPFARTFGANAAYALWSLPLIRLCLPVLSIPESWVPPAFRPAAEPTALVDQVSGFPTRTNADLTPFLDDAAVVQDGSVSILTVILAIWLSVALVWLVFQLLQQCSFKKHLLSQSAVPSKDLELEIMAAATRVSLSKTPTVRVSDQNVGPLITGVIHPLVILPQSFTDDFDREQRNFALIHEFAHLKRKDLWAAFAALVFRAINWPNPLVHFAAHRLRADQEAACDAFVVKLTGQETTHSYAETLVKAARRTGGEDAKIGQLALSLTDVKNEISKGDLK